MSLDIHLYCECCDTHRKGFNITHNLIPMWKEAGIYDALYLSHGYKAGDFVEALDNAWGDMLTFPDKYRVHNPPNGWGSYESAVNWLSDWLDECKAHPNMTIYSWP